LSLRNWAFEKNRVTGKIVITRPRDEAVGLAAELNARGFDTLVEPMLEIVPVPAEIPDLGRYRALAFSSANGVRAFAGRSPIRSIPAYAVGARTAESLRLAGFADIRAAAGDGDAMAALISETLEPADPLLHVSGVAVARDLEMMLAPSGFVVDRLTLYDAVPAAKFSQPLVDALYACTISSVLFFSVRTASAFGTLLQEHGLADMITSISAFCLSRQVADVVGRSPWRRVVAAAQPTSQSMIAMLPLSDDHRGR
jgi:uroporphyrinogen-III synthase